MRKPEARTAEEVIAAIDWDRVVAIKGESKGDSDRALMNRIIVEVMDPMKLRTLEDDVANAIITRLGLDLPLWAEQ